MFGKAFDYTLDAMSKNLNEFEEPCP